jgi:hypothetical protein
MTGYTTDTLQVEATSGRNGYWYRCRLQDEEGNEVYTEPAMLTTIAQTLLNIIT